MLKENLDMRTGCDCGPDDACAGTDENCREVEVRRVDVQKTRKCLLCQTPFPSAWAGERVCRRCKSTSTWRSGGLG